jgi:signal transduction histidine kinase
MTFITYDQDDGISHHAAINGRVLRSSSGKFYLGGNEALIEIDPKEFVINPIPPEVVITGLQVFDDAHPILQDPGRVLSLSYDENELTFHYIGLHFANPARNQYAYYLEGYESNWREVGQTRAATYTNLEPGRYTFWVKAANSDGVWNNEAVSIGVLIQPPWWRSLWAYVFYVVAAMGILFVVDRVQRRRLIAREREKTRERELAQAREIEQAHTELQQTHEHLKTTQAQLIQKEKLASLGQLTAGIAHEIKNPLNFINNFAEINGELAQELRELLNPENDINEIITDLEKNAEVIAQHGKRADAIVSDMMKHATIGTGQFEKIEINQLISEYIDLAYHGKRAQTSDFLVEIKRELQENAGIVELVPGEIGRVILNLLTNAFDSVTEQANKVNGDYLPTIKVVTNRIGDQVEILIADNGTGIPEAMREKIFEPFFTTKPTGTGTGLGLSLSYDIVTQGHNGSLRLQNNKHVGTTFIITLPVVHSTSIS